MKDKKSYTIVIIHRYERQEVLHDCGYMWIYTDMKDETSFKVVDI